MMEARANSSTYTTVKKADGSDFILGEGEFGIVKLVQDQDGRYFAQKEFKKFTPEDQVELDITVNFRGGVQIENEGKLPTLVMPYISWRQLPGKPPQSDDLKKFIWERGFAARNRPNSNDPDTKAMNLAFSAKHIADTLGQIGQSMRSEMTRCHQEGFTWNDCAGRNFLVNPPTIDENGVAKVSCTSIDFGLSKWMQGRLDDDGKPTGPITGVTSADAIPDKLPLKIYDSSHLLLLFHYSTHSPSARNDLFSVKAAMIDNIGVLLGKKEGGTHYYVDDPNPDPDNPDQKQWNAFYAAEDEIKSKMDNPTLRAVAEKLDQWRLERYLENAERMLAEADPKQFSPEYKQAIQCYIEQYREYMTNMPPTHPEPDQAFIQTLPADMPQDQKENAAKLHAVEAADQAMLDTARNKDPAVVLGQAKQKQDKALLEALRDKLMEMKKDGDLERDPALKALDQAFQEANSRNNSKKTDSEKWESITEQIQTKNISPTSDSGKTLIAAVSERNVDNIKATTTGKPIAREKPIIQNYHSKEQQEQERKAALDALARRRGQIQAEKSKTPEPAEPSQTQSTTKRNI